MPGRTRIDGGSCHVNYYCVTKKGSNDEHSCTVIEPDEEAEYCQIKVTFRDQELIKVYFPITPGRVAELCWYGEDKGGLSDEDLGEELIPG